MANIVGIQELVDDIAQLRTMVRRLSWSYVTDVDDALFGHLGRVLRAARDTLGEPRFLVVSSAALRRVVSAQQTTNTTRIPPSVHRDPIARLIDELRALSEGAVSNQFVASVEGIVDLYTHHLVRAA